MGELPARRRALGPGRGAGLVTPEQAQERQAVAKYVEQSLTVREYLALTDKFSVFDEHPQVLRDFLETYRLGWVDGYDEGLHED